MYGPLKRIRVSYMALVLLVFPVSAAAIPSFSNLFVFGHSLSDTGNAAIALTDFGKTPPVTPTQRVPFQFDGPNADLVPGLPYLSSDLPPFVSSGLPPRFSSGAVWIEGLASGLGLSADPALAGGTNFAFGGARTGPLGAALSGASPSLLDQFFGFFGGGGPPVIDPDALYVVWGGGDDGRDIAKAKAASLINDLEASALIAEAVSNVAAIIGILADAGGEYSGPKPA